ncbi:unnamed protein product [Menidia menidia]|uniref:(Atlantic silverside) hypothetical protein n=1 Tax=Menidia menidia TaxID=238744 RepID=A0A8S4AJ20_9TELE|nr:unnamed protein product [Menidia menidia]
MKAPVGKARGIPLKPKRRVRDYASFIYRSHKEAGPNAVRSSEFLACRQLRFPQPILLKLVSLEASRLSKTNRLKEITLQEISAAVTLVQKRIGSRAAA